jgi:replicative DNA helicase
MRCSRRQENKVQEVSEISRNIKALAKELDVPIILVSQLSRAVEAREDKRPILSDLRESGGLEQDADMVWMLYRGDYQQGTNSRNPADTEVLVRKHRNGSTGVAHLMFFKHFTRFNSMSKRGEAIP